MPKRHTLISGIRNKSENAVNDLRNYEPPPEVQVYKATPDWLHQHNLEFLRPEPPTLFVPPKFNERKRGK